MSLRVHASILTSSAGNSSGAPLLDCSSPWKNDPAGSGGDDRHSGGRAVRPGALSGRAARRRGRIAAMATTAERARGTAKTPDLAVLRRLRLAKDLMDRDWSEPLNLDAVAAHAGYSRYHFVRRFRDAYGETPGQYLTRRRIE